MTPRRSQRPFTSPVLIGAVTVLIAILAMYLAYNSNTGLPFVPTDSIKVDIGDGSNLIKGNDVREGGFLVGIVTGLKPVTIGSNTIAQLTLSLHASDFHIPVDSTFAIDSKSVLGLKYVAIHRGTSTRDFADGATVPIRQTNVPVQLDTVFDTFDPRTRNAIEQNLLQSGDLFAGRGCALNDTLHALPSLFGNLEPVAQYLSAPSTALVPFTKTLNSLMGTLQPVATALAQGLGDAGTTFGAISRSPGALESTIARSPKTLQVSTGSLAVQRPFLADLATLGTALTPATASLRTTLPVINPAIEQGTRVLPRTPALDTRLSTVFASLQTLAQAPGTNIALNGVTATVKTLDPMIRYLGPYVTVCNDWNYWWTFLAGDIDEETSFGYAQRALLNQTNPTQLNNVGSLVSSAPVNGGSVDTPLGGNEYLHGPLYGAAVDSNGNADCETGQRGFVKKLNYFDPQGRNLDTDQHTPGDQGPTFRGQPRVPNGETFSRTPLSGPQTAYNPTNP